MSLRPQTPHSIPEETQRVAHAAFPKGTLCLRVADELGALYRDDQFAELFPTRGQPAASPARIAMASVLQYVEGLSDRQTADAVRGRIDWKYALALELTDPGFDHTVLSEFRSRLVHGQAELQLLDTLLERCRERGLIRPRGRQRTDSTHVLAAIRVLNRLERVGETMRAALNDLAVMAPDWLQALAPAEWYRRYGRRVENYHLPKTDAAREELARVVAADGERLLAAVDAAIDQPLLVQSPTVMTLRRVWAEQYTGAPGQLRWREVKDMPSPAGLISSPYDTDARYSTKRDVEWVGYKAHLTETCDEDRPHLIVNVETTPATTPDDNMIEVVHESEKGRDLLPGEHLVDKGYTDSEVLVASRREYGVTIVGPVAEDPGWQARAGTGFDKGNFVVDWDRQVVTCPEGQESISWLPNSYPKNGMVFEARFARADCTPCLSRSQCTRSKQEPRIIGLLPREQHEALQATRREQGTEEFRSRYAARAGIEGTHEQAIRRCGLRQCRYTGEAKAHLQHLLTAAAINLVRLSEWWAGTPLSRTRCSRFAALQPAA
jgi:transposase